MSEEKSKKILIGGLILILFIMCIGYSTFMTRLNISSTVRTGVSWDIHYDTSVVNASSVISGGGESPKPGVISYGVDGLSATLTPTFYQPGDSITYTLVVLNAGTIKARLSNNFPTIVIDGVTVPLETLSYTAGNIRFDVENTANVVYPRDDSGNGKASFKVKVSYVNSSSVSEAHTIKISLNYIQAE